MKKMRPGWSQGADQVATNRQEHKSIKNYSKASPKFIDPRSPVSKLPKTALSAISRQPKRPITLPVLKCLGDSDEG